MSALSLHIESTDSMIVDWTERYATLKVMITYVTIEYILQLINCSYCCYLHWFYVCYANRYGTHFIGSFMLQLHPSRGIFTYMYSLFNILTTGLADTVCFGHTWSQSVKKANFAWFPVHRVYIKVGIFIAQCALSTLPVWMDLTSPECPGLSLITELCMVCHPEDRSIQQFVFLIQQSCVTITFRC